MASASSRRLCMAIWLVLSSAVLALVGTFVGTLGALMKMSAKNETALINQATDSISSDSRLYGLYGKRLYSLLSPIDKNLNNQTDQIDFTAIFGRWSLDIVFITLGWVLAAAAVASILLPIVRCRPRHGASCGNCCWLSIMGICVTIYSLFDVALVVLVILFYIFRDTAKLEAIEYMNEYAFGQKYAGDMASTFRNVSSEVFSFTLLINFIQRTYSCCGFTSYRDYSGGAARLWTQFAQQNPPATLPLVCCADLTDKAGENNVTLSSCRQDIKTGNYRAVNWNTMGCYRTLVSDWGQRVTIGGTAGASILIVVLSAAIVAGSLLIDLERNRFKSRRHTKAGYKHRLESDNDWQLHAANSNSDDEEFYFPNKIYANGHRF